MKTFYYSSFIRDPHRIIKELKKGGYLYPGFEFVVATNVSVTPTAWKEILNKPLREEYEEYRIEWCREIKFAGIYRSGFVVRQAGIQDL